MINSTSDRAIIHGVNDNGQIVAVPVTAEGHVEVAVHGPRMPFGELHTESLVPIFQSDAVYGLLSNQHLASTDGISGTATAANNLMTVSTGATTIGRFGAIQSRKRLRYRPGQGVVARFTALYSTSAINSVQVAGVGTAESGFYFGYNGTSFGIMSNTGGVRCVNTLTIATGSSTNTNATVTLNGVAFTVAVTNSASTLMTAYEISQGTYTGWNAEQRGSTVVFTANSSGVKSGTYSVTFGSGVGAGTFPGTPTIVGVATTDTWVPQSQWNGDKLDGTGASGATLNPLKGNVYQIDIQYLGFGTIAFKVEVFTGGNNSDFVTVHVINYPNNNTSVNSSQPSFPFTLSVSNVGPTDPAGAIVSASCASFSGFTAGQKKLYGPRFSYVNNVTSSTTNFVPLFTIRNSRVFNGRANQSVVNILSFSGAAKSTNGVTTFYVFRNATLSAGTPNFTQYSTSGVTYIDTAATACTISNNDQLVVSATVSESGQFVYHFTDETTIQPGETITLAVKSVTATAVCLGQVNTREDQ